MKKKRKLQLNIDYHLFKILKKLKNETSASSFVEIVKNAILLVYFLVRRRNEGYDICLRKGKKFEIIVFPF